MIYWKWYNIFWYIWTDILCSLRQNNFIWNFNNQNTLNVGKICYLKYLSTRRNATMCIICQSIVLVYLLIVHFTFIVIFIKNIWHSRSSLVGKLHITSSLMCHLYCVSLKIATHGIYIFSQNWLEVMNKCIVQTCTLAKFLCYIQLGLVWGCKYVTRSWIIECIESSTGTFLC